jgi:membrane protease subunit HflC
MNKTAFLLPVVAIIGAAVLSSLFVVDEREKALVLRFGQIKQVIDEPGIGLVTCVMPELNQLITKTEIQELVPQFFDPLFDVG